MTVLSLPANDFSAASFGLISSAQLFRSPLTGSIQTIDSGWDFWVAEYTVRPMSMSASAAWRDFLMSLKGRSGRFYGYDPGAQCNAQESTARLLEYAPRGAETLGATLDASISVGTYFRIGTELKIATAVAHGAQTDITFSPPLRTHAYIGTSLKTKDAAALMRLTADNAARWGESAGGIATIAFTAVEAF